MAKKKWDAHEIRATLGRMGLTQGDVADALGIHISTVNHVLNKGKRSFRVEMYLSNLFNVDIRQLFPDRDHDYTPRVAEWSEST